jgi:hypothetical protein
MSAGRNRRTIHGRALRAPQSLEVIISSMVRNKKRAIDFEVSSYVPLSIVLGA